jgi:hypothetical protein
MCVKFQGNDFGPYVNVVSQSNTASPYTLPSQEILQNNYYPMPQEGRRADQVFFRSIFVIAYLK